MQLSMGKVMCTVCWDRKGVILLDFLETWQIINFDWYITTPTKLKAWTSWIRPGKKTILLLQYVNTMLYTSLKTLEHTANLCWTILPYPPSSLDLLPSDFHLFGPVKDGLHGQHFPSNDAIIAAVKQWVTSAGADFYEHVMQTLVHGWQKCIANGDDWAEK